MMKQLLAIVASTLVLHACTGGLIYDHYEHTPNDGWDSSDTLAFDVDSIPQAGLYGMTLGLRADSDYPFKSVTVIIDRLVMPTGTQSHDTIACQLVDDDGNILGRGISNYQYSFHIADVHYNQGDSIHVTVRHHMRREILKGINDIGIEIYKKQ